MTNRNQNRQVEKIISRTPQSPADEILAMHFALQQKMHDAYKNREDRKQLALAINYCQQMIALSATTAKAFKAQSYYDGSLPLHRGYEQLCIIYHKEKQHQLVIKLAEIAKSQNWNGDWDKRIERAQKALGINPAEPPAPDLEKIKSDYQKAVTLAKAGRLTEAQIIAITIEHPKAKQLLENINKAIVAKIEKPPKRETTEVIYSDSISYDNKPKNMPKKKNESNSLGCIILITIAFVVYVVFAVFTYDDTPEIIVNEPQPQATTRPTATTSAVTGITNQSSNNSTTSSNNTSSTNTTRRPANCTEARAMGLSAREAAQWSHLDRDKDGVACYGD